MIKEMILALAFWTPQTVFASEGLSLGIGTDYFPLGKVEYGNPAQSSYEIYDNMFVEGGLYYNFNTGFRAGAIISLFSRTVTLGGNSPSDISFWGVGVQGDYEYSISESGGTNLVLGIDSGYGKFKDSNEFANRTDNSYWASTFGGLRYFFNTRYFFEIDYRVKWLEFNLEGNPQYTTFDFNGSSLRLALGYGFYTHHKKSGE